MSSFSQQTNNRENAETKENQETPYERRSSFVPEDFDDKIDDVLSLPGSRNLLDDNEINDDRILKRRSQDHRISFDCRSGDDINVSLPGKRNLPLEDDESDDLEAEGPRSDCRPLEVLEARDSLQNRRLLAGRVPSSTAEQGGVHPRISGESHSHVAHIHQKV